MLLGSRLISGHAAPLAPLSLNLIITVGVLDVHPAPTSLTPYSPNTGAIYCSSHVLSLLFFIIIIFSMK